MTINLIFQILAAVIISVMGVVLLGKTIAQKRQGIGAGLLNRGSKPPKVFAIELTLKICIFSAIFAQCVSILWYHTLLDCLPLRIAGAVVSLAGLAFLGAAIGAMRESWRTEIPENDHTELVTGGIFRISRNPAFLGFDMIFAGLLAMFFNPFTALCTLGVVVAVGLQIAQEEKYLTATFGEPYKQYTKRTRRYLGIKNAK